MTYDYYPEAREHKRVILCNLDEYKNLGEGDARMALMGMGLYEWEDYMDRLLNGAITEAREHGENSADVTEMFSCNLVGIDEIGKYTKPQKDVIAHLMEKLFDTVSDTEEELTVAIKDGVQGRHQKSVENFKHMCQKNGLNL